MGKKEVTYRNFDLDGIYVYFRSRIAEIGIEFEYVSVINVFARW